METDDGLFRFGELVDKVENLAKALANRGYGEGTVVAVLLPNCIQVWYGLE